MNFWSVDCDEIIMEDENCILKCRSNDTNKILGLPCGGDAVWVIYYDTIEL